MGLSMRMLSGLVLLLAFSPLLFAAQTGFRLLAFDGELSLNDGPVTRQGMPLAAGDKLSSGESAHALIFWTDRAAVTLGPKSRLVLGDCVTLLSGRLHAVLAEGATINVCTASERQKIAFGGEATVYASQDTLGIRLTEGSHAHVVGLADSEAVHAVGCYRATENGLEAETCSEDALAKPTMPLAARPLAFETPKGLDRATSVSDGGGGSENAEAAAEGGSDAMCLDSSGGESAGDVNAEGSGVEVERIPAVIKIDVEWR